MQSLSDVMNDFTEEVSWFARAHEERLFVVRADGQLRSAVLETLVLSEYHADNFSPWILFEDAHRTQSGGWQARTNRLVEHWDMRREAMEKKGVELAPLCLETQVDLQPLLSGTLNFLRRSSSFLSKGPDEFVSFGQALAAAEVALTEPLKGIVVILAPSIIESLSQFELEVEKLLKSESLKAIRFIVVLDEEDPVARKLLNIEGINALQCNCILDKSKQNDDLEAMLSQAAAGGGGGAQTTFGAGPSNIAAPPRKNAPPEIPKKERDKVLNANNINPEFLDNAPQLNSLILEATVLMNKGQGKEAIELQKKAVNLASNLDMYEVQIVSQITLASYMLSLSQNEEATGELEQAARLAREKELLQYEAQSRLGLGLVYNLEKKYAEASRQYSLAALVAEEASNSLLAIEGWRLSGQIALQLELEEHAIECFTKAIRIAQGSSPDEVQISSGPEAARTLAHLCETRGLRGQAASLLDQAAKMESGQIGKPTIEQEDTEATETSESLSFEIF